MNDPKKTGEILRNAREKLGQDIEKISENIRIRKRYLKAMENGEFDKIPGAAYIKGYIKLYSEYLGISEEIKELIQEEIPRKHKIESVKKHAGNNWIIATIFLILFLLLIFLVVYNIEFGTKKEVIDHLSEQDLIM